MECARILQLLLQTPCLNLAGICCLLSMVPSIAFLALHTSVRGAHLAESSISIHQGEGVLLVVVFVFYNCGTGNNHGAS